MLGFCRIRCCSKLLVIAKWRVRMLSSNILEIILLKFMGGMLFGSSTVANFVAFNRSRALNEVLISFHGEFLESTLSFRYSEGLLVVETASC